MILPAHRGQRLRQNSLGLSQITASTLANIAPAMSFFFGFGVIVAPVRASARRCLDPGSIPARRAPELVQRIGSYVADEES